MGQREQELQSVQEKLAAGATDGFDASEIRNLATTRLSDIRTLMATNTVRARAELAKHAHPANTTH
jgi:hypothetical protein